jgi:hypothetical protein
MREDIPIFKYLDEASAHYDFANKKRIPYSIMFGEPLKQEKPALTVVIKEKCIRWYEYAATLLGSTFKNCRRRK